MEQLARPLIAGGWVNRESITGCTQGDIETLLRSQGVEQIPASYREFLEYGGRDPYWLSRGGEWDYEWLLEAKTVAREFVVDDYSEDFSPFESGFIFQTHQGYSFYYFRPENLADPDPEFWIYSATEPVQSIGVSFSEWIGELAGYLPQAIELRNQLHGGTGSR
ncbi:SMI1/KNR4 family protein [Nocardia jinanensis]